MLKFKSKFDELDRQDQNSTICKNVSYIFYSILDYFMINMSNIYIADSSILKRIIKILTS